MAKQPLATLLTDFGWSDPYVPAIKGVILSICPRANLVDITHDIPQGDVLRGAFVLAQAAPLFPPQTVHVVVVDPGVGTERRILAARFAGQVFLFPDNGIITLIAERGGMEAIYTVSNTQLLPDRSVSATFHGRDIFAPIAANILNGLDIRHLGPEPKTYKTLEIPSPHLGDSGIVGQVLYVDHFGNLISNIPLELVRQASKQIGAARVICGGRDVGAVQRTYGMAESGALVALINSMSLLEVAVNGGRASDVLGAAVGTEVRLVAAKGPTQ